MNTSFYIAVFFIGLMYVVHGLLYKYYPPKKLRWWSYGVKFRFATRNQEMWQEANRFIAFPMMCTGVFFIAYGVYFLSAGYIPKPDSFFILIVLSGGLLMGLTKIHLNSLFDKHGQRR